MERSQKHGLTVKVAMRSGGRGDMSGGLCSIKIMPSISLYKVAVMLLSLLPKRDQIHHRPYGSVSGVYQREDLTIVKVTLFRSQAQRCNSVSWTKVCASHFPERA